MRGVERGGVWPKTGIYIYKYFIADISLFIIVFKILGLTEY